MEVRGHLWQTVRLSPPISPRNQTQMVRLGSLRLHQRLSHPLAQQRSKKKKSKQNLYYIKKKRGRGRERWWSEDSSVALVVSFHCVGPGA